MGLKAMIVSELPVIGGMQIKTGQASLSGRLNRGVIQEVEIEKGGE